MNESITNIKSTVTLNPHLFESILRGGLIKLLSKELQITLYDTVAGDGDCGETLAAGAHTILKALDEKDVNLSDIVSSLENIAMIVEDNMGGTSGGLYSIFISALAQSFLSRNRKEGPYEINRKNLAATLEDALVSLFIYTRARTGDTTIIAIRQGDWNYI